MRRLKSNPGLRLRWWVLLALTVFVAWQVFAWGQPVESEFRLEPASAANEWRITRRGSAEEMWRAFDDDGDGVLDRFSTPAGEWTRPGFAAGAPPKRWLVVCIDAVPFEVMQELWHRGHFREFHRPSALVSTFPSDSETAIAAALHAPPGPGYEHQYFDRGANELRGGVFVTLTGRNIPYLERFDYVAPGWHKSIQYVVVRKSWHAEMGRLRRLFRGTQQPVFHAHVSSGDPLFHILTRKEAELLLVEFESVIREAFLAGRGEVGIVLWSDHGNTLVRSHEVPLDALLAAHGWRRTNSLREPRDVVIPSYGLVGFFVVYCAEQAVAELARDLTMLDGAELVIYRLPEGNGAKILSADGARAVLRWSDDGSRFSYDAGPGDPLELLPVFDALRAAGKLDAASRAADADLFAATARARLPDAAARIRTWAVNHVQNPSEIAVSLKPGRYQGSGIFQKIVTMEGTHGALDAPSSLGFAMATGPLPTGPGGELLPENLRLADLLPGKLLPRK